jgi:hypothetical protein
MTELIIGMAVGSLTVSLVGLIVYWSTRGQGVYHRTMEDYAREPVRRIERDATMRVTKIELTDQTTTLEVTDA